MRAKWTRRTPRRLTFTARTPRCVVMRLDRKHVRFLHGWRRAHLGDSPPPIGCFGDFTSRSLCNPDRKPTGQSREPSFATTAARSWTMKRRARMAKSVFPIAVERSCNFLRRRYEYIFRRHLNQGLSDTRRFDDHGPNQAALKSPFGGPIWCSRPHKGRRPASPMQVRRSLRLIAQREPLHPNIAHATGASEQ
jgi:hypothetical protein